MLKIRVKSQFKKDLKKSLSDKKRNTQLLKELIDNHLCITGSVPAEYLPHPLKGNWKPCYECHIQPDFLLIWDIDYQTNEIILVRCGSHSELFG
ncbi:type II toxin-antitoxin system YafQ family toxin [Providencia huaxiensis]|uniref:Type II toxin-antitoxin system YafQ family toxin n=1 Tax=Providencia huaxiensis TaxID=2027290 RepID=A0A8I2DBI5_9GAMM|nr:MULTISPECIES: type II toxin-antitoxin system YafQ family toxin [Providencia]MBN6362825.1 type II toxin-antitoxin system YafQ family toxin [Providencia huaxiensis]MBQ0269591.1 type II toxin-antitoxin system YafQ family toxin [Providencia huaxiensis]QPE17493.1 type II toxin-antitoxin system YafQ family toxin [Providencia rettgeri]